MGLSAKSTMTYMTFAIDKELKAKAEAEAKKLGLNLSAYIRMILSKELNDD